MTDASTRPAAIAALKPARESLAGAALYTRLASAGAPLSVQLPNGECIEFGNRTRVVVRVRNRRGLLRMMFPTMGRLAQAYVEGDLDLEGDLRDIVGAGESLMTGAARNRLFDWLAALCLRVGPASGPTGRTQVSYHYDASNDFYALWLDPRMVYSCAYFRCGRESLEQAQRDKLDHVCRKLRLQPGERLLDMGCGWGALMLHAALNYGARVTGITLSENQCRFVEGLLRRHSLHRSCRVRLLDYGRLDDDDRYDKIASIGMVEHVGTPNLPAYYAKVERLLEPGGLALIHGITLEDYDTARERGDLSQFMERYVFPGGALCAVGQRIETARRSRLEAVDVESLRPHYVRTLTHWHRRLDGNRRRAVELVGERKYRIWRIYMAGCAHAFDRAWLSVSQELYAKRRGDCSTALPLTRQDIYGRPVDAVQVASAQPPREFLGNTRTPGVGR